MLALPFLLLLTRVTRQPIGRLSGWLWVLVALAGLFFAADLAAWHGGILHTRLANATLFGNISSFLFAIYGLIAARTLPGRNQTMALLLAALGVGMLLGRSYELSPENLGGDALCLLAGLFYAAYLVVIDLARGSLKPWPTLALATVMGVAPLYALALAMGETFRPHDWPPLILLALGSQIVGQGLIILALGELPAVVIGLCLLVQPVVTASIGWLVYGERLARPTSPGRRRSPPRWCWSARPIARASPRPDEPCPGRRRAYPGDMTDPISPTEMTLDELRLALAPLIPDGAAFDGWGDAALESAALTLGVPADRAKLAFPGGAVDMIDAWFAHVDMAMAAALPPERLAAMKIRERIRALVFARMELVAPTREALRRALAILARPQHVAHGARLGWRAADAMWRLAGDTATDFNHYSKRATLAALYGATVLAWMQDESARWQETRDFLDRRIDDVMRFEKLKAQLRPRPERHFSPMRFLGRLRYPVA